MKAILEIEVPDNCGECKLRDYDHDYWDEQTGADYAPSYCLAIDKMVVSDYLNANTRHPDCPLKIIEEAQNDKP